MMQHHAAVYESEWHARRATAKAVRRMEEAARDIAGRRSVRVEVLCPPKFDVDVHVRLRIKHWRMAKTEKRPSIVITSVDSALVARRGRLVTTWGCADKGTDVDTMINLIQMVLIKLRSAERRLRR
jgi:hypothetical protein